MPELPEVEVVRRGLVHHVVGLRFHRVSITGARVSRRHEAGPQDLMDRLTGVQVQQARRRGKYLWLVVQDQHALVVHLGMSGQLLVQDAATPMDRHTHAVFDLASSGPVAQPTGRQLRFVDQRTFGGLSWDELVADPWASEPGSMIPLRITHIAPDPLESAFDQTAVVRRLKSRHTEIKRALLDQSAVSGIGNIYADEALWRAQVHGRRLCDGLTTPVLNGILDQAREVMRAALREGGTSFDRLYVNVNGASGYFDRSLHAYGRQGLPCSRCGTPVVREQFMNRSSHFCPRCQPAPRRKVSA